MQGGFVIGSSILLNSFSQNRKVIWYSAWRSKQFAPLEALTQWLRP
jgi:hypothetical protein